MIRRHAGRRGVALGRRPSLMKALHGREALEGRPKLIQTKAKQKRVRCCQAGDFSDVHVVHADGTITWPELSRISNDEMKRLMIESSSALAELLQLRDRQPATYWARLAWVHNAFTKHWDTE